MSWSEELGRFVIHAAVAAALLGVALGPCRGVLARGVAWIGALPRGRAIGVVLGVTLAARLALLPVVHPVYETDVEEYCEKAAAIARDGHPRSVETRWDGSHFYRTLGYSLPLAGWYRVTGMPETREGRLLSAKLFGIATACGVAALLLALGRATSRETAGRVAALGYAAFLPAVMFSLVPYTETWATLLVVASLLAFEKTRRAEGRRALARGAAFGALQGLLVITRTEFAWMPLVAAAWLAWEKRGRAFAPAAAGVLAALAPLAVNHEMRSGYEGHLRTSAQSGLILYFGNNPIEVNGHGNATPEVAAHVAALYAKDPTGRLARDEALDWIAAHPVEAVMNAPKKLYHLWLAEPQGFTWHIGAGKDGGTDRTLADVLRHAAWVEALALLALGVAGVVAAAREFRLFAVILVLHALTWCALAASTRNRYPLEPLLMVAAAAWLTSRPAAQPRSPS